MCIIAIKNKGVELPDESILETMFINNPDGAGFMYAANNKVIIHKGFMTFHSFKEALNKLAKEYNLTELPIIMHFRIATSGAIDGGTTHPFPLSNKRKLLRRQKLETNIGIVHNGVIPIEHHGNMSDTMEYISKKLTSYHNIQEDFYRYKIWRRKIESDIRSKMVFMDGEGKIYAIGEFVKENKMIYSNYSFKKHTAINYIELFSHSSMCKLCPIEGYIIDNEGYIIDCDDRLYLTNKYSQIYEYDFELDLAIPIDGVAYTYENIHFCYDETQASYFNVSC